MSAKNVSVAGVVGLLGLVGSASPAFGLGAPLEMNLYADVDGQIVSPDEEMFVTIGQTIRYVLIAETDDSPGFPFFTTIEIDLIPFDCGGEAEVLSFTYGDWAGFSVPPTLAGDSILGVDAGQLGSDMSNPLEVCSFEVQALGGINLYTAEGIGAGGVAFRTGFFDTYTASVFSAPRIIAVGEPGGGGPCSAADLAPPFGVHDLADIQSFIDWFVSGNCRADLSAPWTVFDLADVQAFVSAFADGCL